MDSAMSYATNPGNLRLELADLFDGAAEKPKPPARERAFCKAEMEIER